MDPPDVELDGLLPTDGGGHGRAVSDLVFGSMDRTIRDQINSMNRRRAQPEVYFYQDELDDEPYPPEVESMVFGHLDSSVLDMYRNQSIFKRFRSQLGDKTLPIDYVFDKGTGRGRLFDKTPVAVDADYTPLKAIGITLKNEHYLPVYMKNINGSVRHLIHHDYEHDFASYVSPIIKVRTIDLPVDKTDKVQRCYTIVTPEIRQIIRSIFSFIHFAHYTLGRCFYGFSDDNLVFAGGKLYFWKVEFFKSDFEGRCKDIYSAEDIISSLFQQETTVPDDIKDIIKVTSRYKNRNHKRAEILLSKHLGTLPFKERINFFMNMNGLKHSVTADSMAFYDVCKRVSGTKQWLKRLKRKLTGPMRKCLTHQIMNPVIGKAVKKSRGNYPNGNNKNNLLRNVDLLRCFRNLAAHLKEFTDKKRFPPSDERLDANLMYLFEYDAIIMQKGFSDSGYLEMIL